MKSLIFSHLAKTFRHHTSLILTSSFVLIFCSFVMVFTLLISQSLRNLLTSWGEGQQMTVYLKEDVNASTKQDLENRLKSIKEVKSFSFTSKLEAVRDFKSQMATYAPDIVSDTSLIQLIPESYNLSLDPAANANLNLYQNLADQIQTNSAVESVSYGQEWLEKYANILSGFDLVSSVIIFLIMCTAGFVVANTVRSSISARREEIEVLELIGASKRFIRTPFMVEGTLVSTACGTIGVTISLIFISVLQDMLGTKVSFLNESYKPFWGVVLFFVASGLLSSWVCLRKINTGYAASQRFNG